MKILNNTVDQAADGRWAADRLEARPGTNRVRNNILYHPSTARGSINYLDRGRRDEHRQRLQRHHERDAERRRTVLTLAQWQAQGHEPHSITATPAALFVNPATDDLPPAHRLAGDRPGRRPSPR